MRLIVAIFLLPIFAVAQKVESFNAENTGISAYFQAYASAEGKNPASPDQVLSFLHRLSDKKLKFKNDQDFLAYIFRKTHQRYLKEYKDYATFNELLRNGNYNCLTATALYALILEHQGFKYKIIETNYHMFLLVETVSGTVLIESTDPLQGFVTKEREIERKISEYRQNSPVEVNNKKSYYAYQVSVYNPVSLQGVQGLLYYNLAVDFYNKQDLISSVNHLEKAFLLYESQRLEEFSKVITLTLLESKIPLEIKEELLHRIKTIKNRPLRMVVASTNSF